MDRTSRPIHTAELPWMPLARGVAVRPLRFAGDERSLQLKVEPGFGIGRHRHTGAVHAYNVSGSRLLGNGEVAGPGAYVFEPAGNEDAWACDGGEPVIVHIVMSGEVIYLGDSGETLSVTDTASLRASYRDWCAREGVEACVLDAEGGADADLEDAMDGTRG